MDVKNKVLINKINHYKRILNSLLSFFSPTDDIVVFWSCELDKLIVEYQKYVIKKCA